MKIQLKRRAEFEAILNNYQPHPSSREVLERCNATILVGPTSSGRNTIVNKLVETGKYHWIVSDTTRPKRTNDGVLERDGVEYWFRSEDDMLADLKEGRFLEAAIIHNQQVSGISLRELELAEKEGKIPLAEIEIAGAESTRRLIPNVNLIFILPPDFDTWMTRLRKRGDMPIEELRSRLNSAVAEIDHLKTGYYSVVINNNLDKAVEDVREIAEKGVKVPYEGSAMEQVAEKMRQDVVDYLENL